MLRSRRDQPGCPTQFEWLYLNGHAPDALGKRHRAKTGADTPLLLTGEAPGSQPFLDTLLASLAPSARAIAAARVCCAMTGSCLPTHPRQKAMP